MIGSQPVLGAIHRTVFLTVILPMPVLIYRVHYLGKPQTIFEKF
jgi:hypothetical protein